MIDPLKKYPEAFILQNKPQQWSWELHVDGELHMGGAGYESEADAIEGMQEATADRFDAVNVVLRPL